MKDGRTKTIKKKPWSLLRTLIVSLAFCTFIGLPILISINPDVRQYSSELARKAIFKTIDVIGNIYYLFNQDAREAKEHAERENNKRMSQLYLELTQELANGILAPSLKAMIPFSRKEEKEEKKQNIYNNNTKVHIRTTQ